MRCRVGDEVLFSKTIGESDVYLFAGITGDFYEAHVNQAAMSETRYAARIVHGALLVGFMSAAGTRMIHEMRSRGDDSVPVSLGYDLLRFVAPVFFGDTVTVAYRIEELDEERRRSIADVAVTNQTGEAVAVAKHIMNGSRQKNTDYCCIRMQKRIG